MILVIDAGNSRLKWGIAASDADVLDGDWHGLGAIGNGELAELGRQWVGLPVPDHVLCSNVAGAASAQAIGAALATWGIEAIWLRPQSRAAGLTNLYDAPGQLGPDRWATAVAAWHRKRSACIVVNAGTATTVDFISPSAEFLGGMILPGVTLMKKALQRGTAELPLQAGAIHLQSRNTADAIETGCLIAQLGAIEHARRAFLPGAPLLLSGGASVNFLGRLAEPLEQRPHLALEGLFMLASAPERQA
jgi:type III pantothenate kinase